MVAGAALVLAACGGGSGSAGAPSTAASRTTVPASVVPAGSTTAATTAAAGCLLTAAEAEAALGSALAGDPRVDRDPPDGTHGCEYPTRDAALIFALDAYDDPDRMLPAAGGDLVALSGLGTRALYDRGFHRVYVDSGQGLVFEVRFVIGDIEDEQATGTRLAQAVLAHR